MPDNAQIGATNVAADELRIVNGVDQVEPLPKGQRVRPVHGADGDVWDTSDDHPLPVAAADVVAAIDTLATALGSSSPVALDSASLAALENITATLSGPVALDNATLAALEQITATLSGVPHVVVDTGTYGYASGTAAGTVDVPAGARVKRVSVIAGSGAAATITIAGGSTITIPAGGSFDEQIPGDATAGADVVIGGTVSSFYVGWVS
jgi:hypothetical protein